MPPKKRSRITAPVPKLYEVLSHAHIRDAVLEELPHPSLLALRAVSKIWRDPVDIFLIRHVIIKDHPTCHSSRWVATTPLGPIPRKEWHKSAKMVEEVKCIDLRRRHPPPWTAKVNRLKSLRYQVCSIACSIVAYPTTRVTIRCTGDRFTKALDMNIASDPTDVVLGISTQTAFKPELGINLKSLTVLAVLSESTGPAFQNSDGYVFTELCDFVAQQILGAHRLNGTLPVTLAGLESWFGLPIYNSLYPWAILSSRRNNPTRVFKDSTEFTNTIRANLISEVSPEAADLLLSRLTYIKLDDYRKDVGDERFKFETELVARC